MPQGYFLWVAGTAVTEENAHDVLGDGTVSYDLKTNTLTLTGTDTLSGSITRNSDVPTVDGVTKGNITAGILYSGQEILTIKKSDSLTVSTGIKSVFADTIQETALDS